LRVNLVQEQRAPRAVAVTTSGGGDDAAVGATPVTPVKASAGEMKAGRNDACPCGSGKKFKKCHGA
jgi:preprotein translocase subunit SecA